MKTFHCLILLCLFAQGALAQEIAIDTTCGVRGHERETWLQCFNRILRAAGVDGPVAMGSEPSEDQEKAMLAKVDKAGRAAIAEELQDNLASAAAGGSASVLRELLPRLLASLGFDGLSDNNGELRFAHNFEPIGKTQWGLEATAKEPSVLDQITNAYPEAERADRKQAATDQLGDFDDVTLLLSISILDSENAFRFGREPRLYGDLMSDLFLGVTLLQDETVGRTDNQRAAVREALRVLPPINQAVAVSLDQAAGQEAFDRLMANTLAAYKRLAGALTTARYFDFADLIDNQPQFVVTASQTFRDELVGPESWSASLSWQGSTAANVNGLLRDCSPKITALSSKSSSDEAKDAVDCYRNYLPESQNTLKEGWRWSVTAEYKKTDAWAFSSPDDGIELDLDESDSWMAKAAIGRSLRLDDEGDETARFDFEATYDDVSDDEMRQDRFIATATVTQRLVDDMALSLSVVYANKPEYRGEVDEEFSARAGFKYKIKRKSDG